MTNVCISRDGTPIAYDTRGAGPAMILAVGAFNLRSTGEPLAEALAADFTVHTYDRRGRGDSGDTLPYDVGREVDDLDALVRAAGGSAAVFGFSSGGALALRAAARGVGIDHLVTYDLPIDVDDPGAAGRGAVHVATLTALVADGRRSDAVEYFQREMVGLPEALIAEARSAPFWPALEEMAHTLVYEATLIEDPVELCGMARSTAVPALYLAGGAGAPFMATTARHLAALAPDGHVDVLEGHGHDLDPDALAPLLREFVLRSRAAS